MSEYIMNMETQKLELYFEKEDYVALPDELKKEIKSNFLFSRKHGACVKKATSPLISSIGLCKLLPLSQAL